jgi:hypothetical protein
VEKRSPIANVLGIVVVGSLIYPVVAQVASPPLEPTRTFIHWQAMWGNGTYGVKYTFAVTWISLLCALILPLVLVTSVASALTRKSPPMPPWPRLAWKRLPEPARGALALVVTLLGVLFAVVCLDDPRALSPVGFLAKIVLIVAPLALLMGPMVLLDAALPAGVVVGNVEKVELLETQQGNGHSVRYLVHVGGRQFEVAEELWRQIAVGHEVALRSTEVLHKVIEVARR